MKDMIIGIIFFIVVITLINIFIPRPLFDVKPSYVYTDQEDRSCIGLPGCD